jgi:hypothetical protein
VKAHGPGVAWGEEEHTASPPHAEIHNPAGRPTDSLRANLSKWKTVQASPYVERILEEGARLPFTTPPQPSYRSNAQLDAQEQLFVRDELNRLQGLGAVSKVTRAQLTCVNPIFVVPKTSEGTVSGYRLIIDMREPNKVLTPERFRYDTLRTLAPMLAQGQSLVSVDLKDAYFHVRMYEPHRTYMGFSFTDPLSGEQNFYYYNVLPFGMSASPAIFTSLTRPISRYIADVLGVPNCFYVDDIMLLFKSHAEALIKSQQVIDLLTSLGWFLSPKKSSLVPEQRKRFLGMIVSTTGAPCYIAPLDRVRKLRSILRRVIKDASRNKRIHPKTLQRAAGQMVSMTEAILPAKTMLRRLYHDMNAAQKMGAGAHVLLSPGAVEDLTWWSEAMDGWNGRPVSVPQPVAEISTDASHIGCGVNFRWINTPPGIEQPEVPPIAMYNWAPDVASQSSNFRELMGIYYALASYAPLIKGKSLLLLSDNVTSVAQVNKFGSCHPKLAELARAIHQIAQENGIALKATHVPGVTLETSSISPDALSREREEGNWKMDPALFQALDKHFGGSDSRWTAHTVDCFASFANTQIPSKFYTRFPDPSHMPVDFFRQTPTEENLYVNPPWALLTRVVEHLVHHRAVATVVAPYWPRQAWFQRLKALSTHPPVFLPVNPDLFRPTSTGHRPIFKNPSWKVIAFRISGSQETPGIGPETWLQLSKQGELQVL